MTPTIAARPVLTAHATRHSVVLGRPRWVVSLPSISDPRLHVAAVIVSVQVLGQVVIGFDVSIAQILLAILVCSLIEIPMTMWESRTIAWPASALLTGNGIALLLRTPGTEHGDWWSLNGWPVFVAAAAIAMFSKYAIRFDGRHIFNPSNLGLVAVFLLFGSNFADPQDLWWGPWTPGLAATVVLIVVGGITLSRRLHLFDVVVGFWSVFAAGIAVLAIAGHAITARWSITPVEGFEYWLVLVTSPEIIIFVFFMITDPRTMPISSRARVIYAIGVAVLATILVALQGTEYATKVAVLAALTIMCATRPALERILPEQGASSQNYAAAGSPGYSTVGPATAAAALVFLVSTASVQWLGENSSAQSASAQGADLTASDNTPSSVDCGALPQVTLNQAVADSATSVDPELADDVACDVVNDLRMEADALRNSDPRVLGRVLYGERLERTQSRIAANSAESITEDWTYEFNSLELVLLRDPVRSQAIPELGIRTTGEITVATLVENPSTVVDDSVTYRFEAVYRMVQSDDQYLIRQELPADHPMVLDG